MEMGCAFRAVMSHVRLLGQLCSSHPEAHGVFTACSHPKSLG